jgi:type IX secretion system substrate protein
MEKLKLLFCALTITSIGLAQQPKSTIGQETYLSQKGSERNIKSKPDNEFSITYLKQGTFQPVVLWSEDFINGIPADWINIGTINPFNGDTALWEYRGPNTNPDTSVGTRGYYGLNRKINSPTRLNGWVIFDSDYQDNKGIKNNDGNGPVPAPHYGSLITGVIDLSGEPFVKLEMVQYFRYFASTTKIFISIDSGKTWLPDTIKLNTNIARNASNDPDDFVSIDISKWAGGQSGVKIRFEFNSFTLPNGLSGYYFWQLDDIRIIRRPKNDLQLRDVTIQQDDRTLFYGFTPQFMLAPTSWKTEYLNMGRITEPNTKFTVEIKEGNNLEYLKSSVPVNLEPDSFHVDSISKPADLWMPTDTGRYEITIEVSSDSTSTGNDYTPDNNIVNQTVFITESTLGIDAGHKSRSYGNVPIMGDIRLANLFEIDQPYYRINSVYVGIDPWRTKPGGPIKAYVRDTTGGSLNTGFPNIVCESDYHRITTKDTQRGYIILPIPDKLLGVPQKKILDKGWYYISVESYGGTTSFGVWDDETVQQPAWASIMSLTGTNQWETLGNALHIRGNFDFPNGIEDKTVVDFQISPNPATDYVHLDLTTESVTDFHIVITNISGQIMKQEYFNNTSIINTSMDVSDLASGIYFVQVTTENKVFTRKLVINR